MGLCSWLWPLQVLLTFSLQVLFSSCLRWDRRLEEAGVGYFLAHVSQALAKPMLVRLCYSCHSSQAFVKENRVQKCISQWLLLPLPPVISLNPLTADSNVYPEEYSLIFTLKRTWWCSYGRPAREIFPLKLVHTQSPAISQLLSKVSHHPVVSAPGSYNFLFHLSLQFSGWWFAL